MLESERESTALGNLNGQGATTEAGESPREANHKVNGVSMAQTPSSRGNGLAPIRKQSAKGSKPDANPQHPNALSVVNNGKAGESLGLRFPNASPDSNPPETKHVPIAAALDVSSQQPKAPLGLMAAKPGAIAVAMASATVPSTGAELPMLALGQDAAVDRTNPKTRPLASAGSKLQIPSAPSPAGQPPKGKTGTGLRRGKWTVEEETYVARVIQDFNSGFLNAPAGTTLRSYLSEKLQCDPMRITKKFTGDSCIGKRVFHPAVRNPSNAAAIDKAQAELESLERRWRRRLEMQQRESAKKAAASAAAAAAATGRAHGFTTQGAMGTSLASSAALMGGQKTSSANGVTQTASWLDRASNILKETGSKQTGVSVPCSQQKFSLTQEQAQALQSLPKKEIEMQMKEVERLIHEGPIIQQTTAGLPLVLTQSASDLSQQQHPPPVPTTIVAPTAVAQDPDGQQTPPEPADKRMRTGAEDAEALVGFLTAVRASAAAGTDSFTN